MKYVVCFLVLVAMTSCVERTSSDENEAHKIVEAVRSKAADEDRNDRLLDSIKEMNSVAEQCAMPMIDSRVDNQTCDAPPMTCLPSCCTKTHREKLSCVTE